MLNLWTSCDFQLNNTERLGKTSGLSAGGGVVTRSGKVIVSIHTRKFGSGRSRTGASPRQSVLEEEVIPVPGYECAGEVSNGDTRYRAGAVGSVCNSWRDCSSQCW